MEPLRRDIESLVRLVREEMRAEGPDGAGLSDFFIAQAINHALGELAEVYPIRDRIEFVTEEDQNDYNLSDLTTDNTIIENILRVTYNGTKLQGIALDDFLDLDNPTDGEVKNWLLWGTSLRLVGEVTDGNRVELWINRSPRPLDKPKDEPETPYYADPAIIFHVAAACYRETKEFDRANYYHSLFQQKKTELLRRGVPQGQRDFLAGGRKAYYGPIRSRVSLGNHFDNPGGGC